MRYPVSLVAAGPYLIVTFPDMPTTLTQGTNVDNALRQALNALQTAFWHLIAMREPIPEPSSVKLGQHFIDLPLTVAAKVLLHNEMLRQKVQPATLAKRMGIPQERLNRILNLRYETRIDITARAFEALGKHLEPYVV